MLNTTKSEELYKVALDLMPGGVNSPVRAFGAVGRNPLFIDHAKGSYVYDVDGNELGKVENVLRTGSNDVYQTRLTAGGELLIPALKSVVKEIDIKGSRMVVDMPEEISDAH